MTGDNEKIIGSYRIEKTLGQGTFGKVKQGIHIHTEQKVAIKILEKKKIKDVNDVERVTREIHILKIVRHPNIIQLYEIIETQSKLYLIMEHCSNGELFDYITSRNRLKEEEACRLFQQLIAGIEYIGELGIAHRDVKPENLLLDDFKNLKIVDFGLSNTFKPGEKLSTACGSPCYAAPELIRGKEYIGQKADIWSAGVVLYTEVCGYLPFEDQNTQSLYQKILKADFKLPSFLSKEVKDLILQILVPDPDLRFGIKQIKQHKWFNIYKPPKEISKGIKVGIDDQKIYPSLLKEMMQQSGTNERYTRQCIEANRHNAATAHYYLLLKMKQLDGKLLDDDNQEDETNQNDSQIITASSQLRLNKSVVAPRTTKYAQNHQLRKIAEGLGDIKVMRFQNSRENSIECPKDQSPPQQKIKGLKIKAPTLQEPDLPAYDDYGASSINTTLMKHRDLNRSLDQEQIQPLAQLVLNESQTIGAILNRNQMSNLDQSTNRIRIKTKFKMTPSNLNKSLNAGSYTSNIPTSNNFRMKTQMKRINRANQVNSNYSNRLNEITLNNNYIKIDQSNFYPREPNITKMSFNTISSQSNLQSKNTRRKTSFSQYKLFDSINIQENNNSLTLAESSYFKPPPVQYAQQNTINIFDNSINIGSNHLNESIVKTLNAYNQSQIPRNYLNQTADLYGKQKSFNHSSNTATPSGGVKQAVLLRRKTPSINVNTKFQSYNLTNNQSTRQKSNRAQPSNQLNNFQNYNEMIKQMNSNPSTTRSQSFTKRNKQKKAVQEINQAIGIYLQDNQTQPLLYKGNNYQTQRLNNQQSIPIYNITRKV
ncbi:carbon catabolite derepressing protein [Stylonychia lemnae]|uniref:non-specific serine/threonine protein kinase n=1 Tax=Stylonychia lemnae TaxID=5949 RepID=A0A078AI93_STYLE|nr:carbon catabolite derepressing protein [Stylonychia lemnae]|eukprot:CDW81651.1 carbon catabolite derepressing protein [Stylonychia lemnae]